MNMITNRTIELLNSEGTILYAEKIYEGTPVERFVLWDEWDKQPVADYSHGEFKMFIRGQIDVIDSHERVWNYANQHSAMKPHTNEEIERFIGKI